jgi:hypothetical protein
MNHDEIYYYWTAMAVLIKWGSFFFFFFFFLNKIICPNLREFGDVIIIDHLLDLLNPISDWTTQFLEI